MTYQHSVAYKEKKKPTSEGEGTYFACSLCGYEWSQGTNIKYCPNCGLRIDLFKKIDGRIDGRIPVTFEEAIKAFKKGSNIKCECSNCEGRLKLRGDNMESECRFPEQWSICCYAILHGTWYIEE